MLTGRRVAELEMHLLLSQVRLESAIGVQQGYSQESPHPLPVCGRGGGVMIGALDSESSGLGSSPDRDTALCSWER